jgi:two-component system, sensor histidine kinase PdtaS
MCHFIYICRSLRIGMSERLNTMEQEVKDYLEQQRFILVVKLSLFVSIAFIVLAISFSGENLLSFAVMVSGVIITTAGFVYTYLTKKHTFTFVLYSLAAVCVSGFSLLNMHTATHYGEFLWMTAGIMLGFLGLGKKYGILMTVLAIIFTLLFIHLELNYHITQVPQRDAFQKFAVSTEITVAFGVIGYIISVFVRFHNFSQNRLLIANQQLETINQKIVAQDEEKTILVKEIHHRVKNNLQIISSLLRLQSGEIDNEELRAHFDEATNRISVMATIHQRLYDGNELSKIQLVNYVQNLATDIHRVFSSGKEIQFDIHSEIPSIGLKSIVPFGLIINELISNSLKYAFVDSIKGTVSIRISKLPSNEGIQLYYEDNGIWQGDPTNVNGFGLELIDMLTEQLDGTKHFEVSENKSCYTFEFPQLNK